MSRHQKWQMRALRTVIVFSICLGIVSSLAAQIGGSGSIQGVVSDPSGAVIPGVSVEATNVATGVKTTRLTTGAGFFVISPLTAGEYTITVTAAGFQKLVQEHIVVDALNVVGFNPILRIGAGGESVTVTDTPPVLNTSDGGISQTVRNDIYTALPLAMGSQQASINSPRDPTAFVALMPGITGYGTNNVAGQVGGAPAFAGEVYVEGVAVSTTVLEGEVRYLSLGISVEAVDQFQLQGGGASVMYAGQGSTNFVLKSGTNEFHGLAFENIRNSFLDARGFFPTIRPANRQNEFGGTLGGPIKKNKVFFFASYGGYRTKQDTLPLFLSIPTLKQRNGDFTELPTTIYDPQSTNCTGPCTRQPFAGNLVPGNRISPASKFFQQFLPNPTNSNIQSNYLGSVPVGFSVNSIDVKIDENLSDKHRIYGLLTRGKRAMTTNYRNGNIPLPYTDTRTVTEVMTIAQLRHTYVVTNTVLNQVSLAFNRFWVPISDATIDSNCGYDKLCGTWTTAGGLKGLPPGAASQAFPTITFSGPNSGFGWRVGNSPAFNEAQNTLTLQDNVQWTHGKHAFTFGGQVQWLQANEAPHTYGSQAAWTFSNTQVAGFGPTGTLLTATGNSYASYLLGAVNSTTVNDDYVVEVGARFRTYGWWVQDNIKLSSRLTVNLGLRHDFYTPWVEVKDRMSWLNPDLPNPALGGFPGGLEFAGKGAGFCNCRNYKLSTYPRNFQPRVGFAFSLSSKTVIRAGYSIMSSHKGATAGSGSKTGTGLLGYSANPSFSSLDGGISPAYFWDNGVPAYQKAPFFDPTLNTGFTTANPTGSSITYGDPDGAAPARYQNWNLSLQHALTSTLTLEANYVANNGHHLAGGPTGIFTNQMNPKYLALGNLLRSSVTPATLASAKAIFPEIALPFANFSGTFSQMLRKFPQYSSVSNTYGAVANLNYNSLQIVARKMLSHGLSVNFNYTLSKAFNDLSAPLSAFLDDKAQSTDPTHVFNLITLYKLPFGKGRAMVVQNPVLRALVSDWQISGVTTYRSGTGLGAIVASCNVPGAGGCRADYNAAFSGPVRINGSYGDGNLTGSNLTPFLDKNAFVSPAAFTFGNTSRTLVKGLRGPASKGQDISLRREFGIREGVRLTFEVASLNVFNLTVFGTPNIDITSANFGTITSQVNKPRLVQFGARVTF